MSTRSAELPIRIHIVDDQLITRMGLRSILSFFPDFVVVGEDTDGDEAIESYDRLLPDIVLMDIRMKRMHGIEAAGRIIAKHPEARIIILSNFFDAATVNSALATRVSAYLLKSTTAEELFEAIHEVMAGRPRMSSEVMQLMMENFGHPTQTGQDLTPREREILTLLARGMANTDMALKLSISAATVKNHLNNIFSKLGASNRTEAVSLALKHRLVVLD